MYSLQAADTSNRATSRRRFLELTAGASALGVVPATQMVAGASTPTVRTVFSYPTLDGSTDSRHEESFMRLVERATPGSEIYFSMYIFTRGNVARALVDAAERGVKLNVLIDERSEYSSATGYVRDRVSDDALGIVSSGGIGNRINHNKFLLVEELRNGDTHVVWQSSSNFTDNQVSYHNSTVVIRNDPELYEAYRSYWKDLADEGVEDIGYNRTEETDAATVYFSPRSDFDTHVRALQGIVQSPRTRIHIMQSIWTESRERESGLILDHLAPLVEDGAEVRVVIQQRGNSIPFRLEEAGVEFVRYPSDARTQVHSKNMLVDAEFETADGGTERSKEVWTGTQNLSRPGLRRNDETLLRIVSDYVYEDFLDDWEQVFRQARCARAALETEETQTSETAPDETTRTQTPAPTGTTSTPQQPESDGDGTGGTVSESGPGFGVVSGFAALAGAGYLAYRRTISGDD